MGYILEFEKKSCKECYRKVELTQEIIEGSYGTKNLFKA